MNSKTIATLIIIALIIIGVFYLFNRIGKVKTKIETFNYPPFTINKQNIYSTRYDINTARTVDNSRSYYSVYFQEKLIEIPKDLNENTGVPGLWKVFTLVDAPQPTLIAGSKGVYLLFEENNECKIIPLSEYNSGFASLQWLDSMDGQPGPRQELYSTDDTNKNHQLAGGQFLLINERTVLDVKDLSIYPYQISSELTENYSANQVVAFSPDKEQIVYFGSRYDGEDRYALLVYNFKTNRAYTIAFNRTETQLHEPSDIHPNWLTTYFKWTLLANGHFELTKQNFETPPNWEGHFTREKAYALSPVKKEMLEVFATFIKDHLQLSDTAVQIDNYGMDKRYVFNVGKSKVEVNYLESIESVYFSDHILNKDKEGYMEVIKKVGDAFNNQLRKGEYQNLFTSY